MTENKEEYQDSYVDEYGYTYYKCPCNMCGTKERVSFKEKTYWGYESTGKDTSKDVIYLCRSCMDNFTDKTEPVCDVCKRDIADVMAYLAHKNPHSYFYGLFEEAQKHYRKKDNHCGLEFATIRGRTVCEICYQDFTNQFAIPIPVDYYMAGCTPDFEFVENNRIEKAYGYEYERDAVSEMADYYISYDEVIAINKMSDKASRVIAVNYRQFDESYSFGEKKRLGLCTGDRQYIPIESAWIDAVAPHLNFFDLEILDHGKTVMIDGFPIHVPELLKRARKEEIHEDNAE